MLGATDHSRLMALVAKSETAASTLLYDEVDSATVVADDDVPGDVVTMGSIVTFRDIDTGRESTVTLAYPAEADASRGRISILAPVGAALIGLRVGERIAWPVPNGKDRHLEVVRVAGGPPRE
jgi:regulator of nucleoside diphosphate kinase